MHAFPDRFRTAAGVEAPTVVLARCHRAGAGLVEATHRVAVKLRGPSRHRSLTGESAPSTVVCYTFASHALESAFLKLTTAAG